MATVGFVPEIMVNGWILTAIEILHRNDLPLGGFAGLKEYRLVMSPKLFGPRVNPGTWSGIAGFVYLADASALSISSHTVIEIASLRAAQNFVLEKPFLAYLAIGNATVKNLDLEDGDLIKGNQLSLKAESDVTLIVIYEI
ncbi:MAG: hypothetical protein ABFS22_06480 [Pseudomonadota bacterium]